MKKNLLFLIMGFVAIGSAPTWACSKLPDSEFRLVGSYESGKQAYSGKDGDTYAFQNCGQAAGQYFVVTTAPVYTDLNMKGISSPEGELPEDSCRIDQSPFSASTPADINVADYYRDETTLLSSCLEYDVTDARGDIDASTQINCEVAIIGKGVARVRGPRCSFKLYDNSQISVKFHLAKDCLNKAYLKQAGNIMPMDVNTEVGFYRTPDLTPGNPNYEILTIARAKVTLQPGKDLIPVSSYVGSDTANWPTLYGVQIEPGRVSVSATTRLGYPIIFMRAPLLVNNNCPDVCRGGICTSPCNFYAPVAARVVVSKKPVGAQTFRAIDRWDEGNLVPPRFLGEMSLGKELHDAPAVGDHYLMTMEFSNPAMGYRVLVDEAKQLLIKLSSMNSISLNGSIGTGELNGLGSLMSNLIPGLSDLPEVSGLGQDRTDFTHIMENLNFLLGSDNSWPPYYSQVVNGDQRDSANSTFQTLQVGFRVAGKTPSGGIAIDHIMMKKRSKIFGNYEKWVTVQPQVKCR